MIRQRCRRVANAALAMEDGVRSKNDSKNKLDGLCLWLKIWQKKKKPSMQERIHGPPVGRLSRWNRRLDISTAANRQKKKKTGNIPRNGSVVAGELASNKSHRFGHQLYPSSPSSARASPYSGNIVESGFVLNVYRTAREYNHKGESQMNAELQEVESKTRDSRRRWSPASKGCPNDDSSCAACSGHARSSSSSES